MKELKGKIMAFRWGVQYGTRAVIFFSLFCFGVFFGSTVAAQAVQNIPSVNTLQSDKSLFITIRELAISGNRAEAIALAQKALQDNPNHQDIRTLLGRIYSWEEQYDKSRQELTNSLDQNSDNLDARLALIDTETWAKNYAKASQLINEGLRFFPDDEELLYRQAKLAYYQKKPHEAKQILVMLLKLLPQDAQAKELLDRINKSVRPKKRSRDISSLSRDKEKPFDPENAGYDLSADYTYEHVSNLEDNWYHAAVSFGKNTQYLSLDARVNKDQRFSQWGTQYEFDAYPKIPGVGYFYFNYGHSDDSIFPRNRYGSEFFLSFPAGFEGSFGNRYLQFSSSNVSIWTASVGKYIKNYWLSLRTYIQKKDQGYSKSFLLSIRRYYSNRYHYISLDLGTGASPDDDDINSSDFSASSSREIGLSAMFPIKKQLYSNIGFQYKIEKFPKQINREYMKFNFGLTYFFG